MIDDFEIKHSANVCRLRKRGLRKNNNPTFLLSVQKGSDYTRGYILSVMDLLCLQRDINRCLSELVREDNFDVPGGFADD